MANALAIYTPAVTPVPAWAWAGRGEPPRAIAVDPRPIPLHAGATDVTPPLDRRAAPALELGTPATTLLPSHAPAQNFAQAAAAYRSAAEQQKRQRPGQAWDGWA